MKRCSKCLEEKPASDFYKHIRMKDGLSSVCKPCHKENVLAYRKRNPEKAKAWSKKTAKEWDERHPEKRKAVNLRYRERHRDVYLARKKRWRDKNKERTAANWAAYYARNRERLRAKAAAEYDPEKKRASRKPEHLRRASERRRARLLDAFVADVDFDEILIRDAGVCGICGEQIMEATIELDHTIPLAAGGTHEPDNCQVAHRSCNRRKGVRLAA